MAKELEILTTQQARERLREKTQPEKFDILRILLAIQDATNGMSDGDKELVFSMWLNGILSYDRMLELIE